LPKGPQQASWDGTDDGGRSVPPGVYFYRLVTPEGSHTRRMVMVR
jgi:flagellar hook assembly protein FlgD